MVGSIAGNVVFAGVVYGARVLNETYYGKLGGGEGGVGGAGGWQDWRVFATVALRYSLLLGVPFASILEARVRVWWQQTVAVSLELLHLAIFVLGLTLKDCGVFSSAAEGEPAGMRRGSMDGLILLALLALAMLHSKSMRINTLVPPFSISYFAGAACNVFLFQLSMAIAADDGGGGPSAGGFIGKFLHALGR